MAPGVEASARQPGADAQPQLDRLEVTLSAVSVHDGRVQLVGDARNLTHPDRVVKLLVRIDNRDAGRAETHPPSTRFATTVEARPGSTVCVIPTGGIGTAVCQALAYNATPIGHLDRFGRAWNLTGSTALRLAGWALDADTPGPVTVVAAVDGVPIARVVADGPRPDVAAAFPGAGEAHGFDMIIAARPGSRLCVEALNDHGPNLTLACHTLRPKITITAAATNRPRVPIGSADGAGYFRARSGDTVKLTITASGSPFPAKRLTVETTRTVTCRTRSGDLIATRRQSTSEHQPPRPTSLRPRPAFVTTRRISNVGAIRRSCRPDRFHEFRTSIRTSAETTLGTTARDTAVMTSFGPDRLTIGTLNLESTGGHSKKDYERWAREYGSRADVLTLSEIKKPSRVEAIARAGGFSYFKTAKDADDLAILSRSPLRGAEAETLWPPRGRSRSGSNNLAALTDIHGYPHQIIAVHWSINNADNDQVKPSVDLPGHVRAANWVLRRLLRPRFAVGPSASTFLAGDTNSFAGYGNVLGEPARSEDLGPPDASTLGMRLLAARFTDALRFHAQDNCIDPVDLHHSDKRIDYAFSRGSYVPILYESWSSPDDDPHRIPSDHPYLLVTYDVQGLPVGPSGTSEARPGCP